MNIVFFRIHNCGYTDQDKTDMGPSAAIRKSNSDGEGGGGLQNNFYQDITKITNTGLSERFVSFLLIPSLAIKC